MPQAEIIADRFHVQKAINCELDAKRKELKRKADTQKNKSEKKLKVIHNSKYPLLKNQSNLTEAQQDKLKQVKNQIPILGKMHSLKEDFRKILEESLNWSTGLDELSDWLLTLLPTIFIDQKHQIL